MEKVLDPQITKQIQQAFSDIQEPVQVLLFTSKASCDYCNETQQLLEEVIALNDKVELSVYDIDENQDLAIKFNVTNTPGIVIAAKDGQEVENFGIQYSGIPAGGDGRPSARGGGKSGLRRARWSLTATRGDPRESATETIPPSARRVRVKRVR